MNAHGKHPRLDLNEGVQKLAHLQHDENHHHEIATILDLGKEIPSTIADGQQIESVLFTLLARSRKAIIQSKKRHGTITLRTKVTGEKIQFSITDDGRPDPGNDLSGAFVENTPEDDINLTTCAEIVQEQAGQLYAWRPHNSGLTTIFMELPAGV